MKEVRKAYIYCAVVLSVIVAIVFIALVINTLVEVSNEVKRTTNAQTYDLDCLTQPIEKPLEQCKEND